MKNTYLLFILLISAVVTQAQRTPARLNHIAVYVHNLPRSEAFYINIVQLDTIANPFRDGKHTWFRIGEHSQLHLIEGATEKIATNKNHHLCFSVPSMDALIVNLNKAGIAYEDWPGKKNAVTVRPDGVKQIYIQDPDGYWIEMNDDKY